MTMKNEITNSILRKCDAALKVKIFTRNARPPSKTLLYKNAMIFKVGFNKPPWDIYEFNSKSEKAKNEFSELVSTVINWGGAFISLKQGGESAGFSVVSSLDLFAQDPMKAARYKSLPGSYKSPARYFERLSQILMIPTDEFGTIGYIADVAVDNKFEGKGFGTLLIKSSLKYLTDSGKKYALAWTVNPIMSRILIKEGFKYLSGIGYKGEGVDGIVDKGTWFPSLVKPRRRLSKEANESLMARHYVKEL
jgi:hypothetical protein